MMKLHPETLNFLSSLAQNNSRRYFSFVKQGYEQIREALILFTKESIKVAAHIDETIPLDLDPKKCLFRIYRDARYATPDAPYKTNFGFFISPYGKNTHKAGYYLHLEPGKCFISSGCYYLIPSQLASLREHIHNNIHIYISLTTSRDFKKFFGEVHGQKNASLSRTGFSQTLYPDIMIKKQHLVTHHFSDEEVLSSTPQELLQYPLQLAHPFVEFLNKGYSDRED